MKLKLIILSVLLGISSHAFSQKAENDQLKVTRKQGRVAREQLRAGNKEYKKESYTESEISYRKALEANARSTDAAYNLGNALYKQAKLPEALEQYKVAISEEKDKGKLAASWHNTGNIFMNEAKALQNSDPSKYNESLKKSIEAYKQSLRNNPKDDETRYNLALAQKLLKDSEGNGGGGDDDKKDKDKDKDKEKDKDKQDKEKQDKEQQDKDKQNQDQKDQKKDQQDQQQQQQQQMDKDNAQQILDALMQDEKNTQEKVKEQQVKQQQRKRTDKEW